MENNNYTVTITQGFANQDSSGGWSAGVRNKYPTFFEVQGMYNLSNGNYYIKGQAKNK